MPIEKKVKILITVKTYPLPSTTYQELVCTAGVRENGDWIRLYPIPFRYLPYEQQYKKYSWIEVDIEKNKKDGRLESYKPIGKIEIIGSINTSKNWQERKNYVLKNVYSSLEELKTKTKSGISLGVIKPKKIIDFIVEPAPHSWKDKWKMIYRQIKLLGAQPKRLDKVPYKFSYKFKCFGDHCSGHKIMIEDWEVYQLYRNMLYKYKNEEVAIQKVKDQYLNNFSENKELYFFMGTPKNHHHRETFIIIGVFYPQKEDQ